MKSGPKMSSSIRVLEADSKDRIVGTSELADRIRTFDWTSVGLDPIDEWKPTFLSTVNMLLQSPVAIVTLWGDDGILIYNDAYSIFAGNRHPQLLGAKVVEGWPEVADFNRHVMNEVYKEGKTLSYKDQELILHRSSTPEQLWTDLNYSPIFDTDGTTIGVFAIVTETTDTVIAQQGQKEAERALLAERERLQSLFIQAPALIAVLNGPDHVYEMVNPLYSQTVGPGRDLIGKPMIEALPELAGQGVIEILDTVLETGIGYVGEVATRLNSGEHGEAREGYFNLVYQPLRSDPHKKPDGIFIHAVDITSQVEDRQHMERLNAELEAIFESLPDGVFTIDGEQVRHINQRGAEMLGYESPNQVPRRLEDLYRELAQRFGGSDTIVNPATTVVGRALQGEINSSLAVRLLDPTTGYERFVRSAAAPIRDTDGNVVGAVATASDVTEQHQLESKMQKELIRRRVLSQKAKLLKQQNEQLRILNQTKDEFIALTSHQLRTPATGVKQYLGLVTQGFAGTVTDQQRDFLERAYQSNDRQLQIIDDILRVARIDLDEITIQKKKQNVADLVRRIADEQSETFASRQQTLEVTIADEHAEARLDERNLGMALGNIIDNASKYTDDGKTITVAATHTKDRVVITVTDQGVGIAAEDLDKLFQKFSRIDNSRSIQVGGTGLGLYLSQKLIEKHGGEVRVDSTVGVGTTFTITLPR